MSRSSGLFRAGSRSRSGNFLGDTVKSASRSFRESVKFTDSEEATLSRRMSTAGRMSTARPRISVKDIPQEEFDLIMSGIASDGSRVGWDRPRRLVGQLVEGNAFEGFICVVIMFNTLLIVYEADIGAKVVDGRLADLPDETMLEIVNYVLLGIYCFESMTKLYVYRRKFPRDPWNLFDGFLIGTCIVTDLVGGFIPSLRMVRLFRIARLGKMLRMMAVVSPSMYRIVHGFASAMRSIACASLLLFLIMTGWATIAVTTLHPIVVEINQTTSVYEGCDRCMEAWSSVMEANLTFLQTILIGDSWGKYAIPLINRSPWTILVFGGFFATVMLGMCNLITSMIVDNAAEARAKDEIEESRVQVWCEAQKQNLIDICRSIDSDNDGTISLEELEVAWDSCPAFNDLVKKLNVSRCELGALFAIMDTDCSGNVDYSEFSHAMVNASVTDVRAHVLAVHTELRNIKHVLQQGLSTITNSWVQRNDAMCRGEEVTAVNPYGYAKGDSPFYFGSPPESEAGDAVVRCNGIKLEHSPGEASAPIVADALDVVGLDDVLLEEDAVPRERLQRPMPAAKLCRVLRGGDGFNEAPFAATVLASSYAPGDFSPFQRIWDCGVKGGSGGEHINGFDGGRRCKSAHANGVDSILPCTATDKLAVGASGAEPCCRDTSGDTSRSRLEQSCGDRHISRKLS